MPRLVLRTLEFDGLTVRESVYPAGMRMPRHAHDEANVTAIVSGEIAEASDSGEYVGRPMSVLVKPAGTMHTDQTLGRKPVRTVSLQIPEGSRTAEHIARLSWSWREDPESASAAIALLEALRDGCSERIEAAAQAMLETLSAPGQVCDGPPWIASVLRQLDEASGRPLRFDDLARDLHLHPVYVSRAFRRHMGQSMTDYVRTLRLRNARHQLVNSERDVASIAAATGFADPSHLCRTFRAAHGVSPKVFRRLCAEVQGVPFRESGGS